jgi:hypothetical protein
MRLVSTTIWACFGFFCFAVLAGMIWVGYQFLQAWRQLRMLPDGIVGQVNDLSRGLADVEKRIASMEQQVGDLQRQVDGLSVSLARARVLTGAVNEVRSMVTTARSYIPSK